MSPETDQAERFIVDAQLPRSLAVRLKELGYDARHVKSLPAGGDTSDSEITRVADLERRIVVTKDSDFRHTHEADGHPHRLLLITVGNIKNRDLLALVTTHHVAIVATFGQADFVELGTTALTLHPRREQS